MIRVIVPAELDAARLDRAATALLPQHSRRFIARLIEAGRLAVAGRAVTKPSHRVAAGDEIALGVPPPAPSELVSQARPLTVIYGDAHLRAIDKPSRLARHTAAG